MARPKLLPVTVLLYVTQSLVPAIAHGQQSLDKAVAEQLKGGCRELLFGRFVTDLTGPLQMVCREGQVVVPPVTAASGGGAATPSGASGILQQQQLEKLLASVPAGGSAVPASGDAATLEIGGRLSVIVLGGHEALDKVRSDFEDGYDFDIGRASVAASYRIQPNLFAGLGLDYYHQDGDYDSGGDFDTDSYGITGFGGLRPGQHLSIGLAAGYARRQYERTRVVTYVEGETDNPDVLVPPGPVDGDYDGDAYYAELSIATPWWLGGVTIAPLASLTWSRVEYEPYIETGDTGLELRFDNDEEKSLLFGLGLGASAVVSAGPIAFVPTLELKWLHEFDPDAREVEVSFADDLDPRSFTYDTEKPDRNFGSLFVGLTAVLPNGLRPFVQLQTIFARGLYDIYGTTFGLSFDL